MGVSVKAPAKINLTLDVLQKRADGYHEVEMVMTTIDLADRLHLVPANDGKITVHLSSSFIPTDERNLAYKAARLLQKRYGITKGVSIYITKNIPVAAGLAGGSSNAAATLKGLNELWDLQLSIDTLAQLGTEIGSDVAFCVYGGTAKATGRGEIIQPISAPPSCWVILAKPPIGVSTADIYNKLTPAHFERGYTDQMVQAIRAQDFHSICQSLHNTLESITLDIHPEVRNIKKQMLRFGANGVLMSGSGPTVFGLVEQESRVHRIYNGLRGFCQDVFTVRLIR